MDKKLCIVQFNYDSGSDIRYEICIVRAVNKQMASLVFFNNIYTIFSYNEDLCEITAITEVPDDANLLYTRGGSYWEKARAVTI